MGIDSKARRRVIASLIASLSNAAIDVQGQRKIVIYNRSKYTNIWFESSLAWNYDCHQSTNFLSDPTIWLRIILLARSSPSPGNHPTNLSRSPSIHCHSAPCLDPISPVAGNCYVVTHCRAPVQFFRMKKPVCGWPMVDRKQAFFCTIPLSSRLRQFTKDCWVCNTWQKRTFNTVQKRLEHV